MDTLHVRIDFGDGPAIVGHLLMQGRTPYFRYEPDYLERGHNISPLKLAWTADVQRADTQLFEGLFGVFADSLPDGWGRLLLDRELNRQGTDLDKFDVLSRLAYVGNSGKGALTYRPALRVAQVEPYELILDRLAERSAAVLREEDLGAVPDLLRLGGSSGGARPKIQVVYNPTTKDLLPDTLPVPPGYEAWIIKFPSTHDPSDSARLEYAYYRAALAAGLPMSECRLFAGRGETTYFGTKRFDRGVAGMRQHLHSLAGLVHDNFRLPALDYGHAMDAAFRLENDVAAYRKILRLAAFNVFAHNRDDHSNNLSFLQNAAGHWTVAPPYDLTYSRPAHGEHSMTVAGEGRHPGRKDLLRLADHFRVRGADTLLDEVWEGVCRLPDLLRQAGVVEPIVQSVSRHLREVES